MSIQIEWLIYTDADNEHDEISSNRYFMSILQHIYERILDIKHSKDARPGNWAATSEDTRKDGFYFLLFWSIFVTKHGRHKELFVCFLMRHKYKISFHGTTTRSGNGTTHRESSCQSETSKPGLLWCKRRRWRRYPLSKCILVRNLTTISRWIDVFNNCVRRCVMHNKL